MAAEHNIHQESLNSTSANALVLAMRDAVSTEAQRTSATAMNGSAEFVKNTGSLRDAGAASALATALQEWEDDEAKEKCAMTVACIARVGDESQVALAEAGVLEPLVAFLPFLNQNNSSPAAYALLVLTKNNAEVMQRLLDVPSAMEALEEVEFRDQGYCAPCLCRLLCAFSSPGRLVKATRAG